MKILIVEDEKRLAESIRDLLTARGFEADAVYDGESGVSYGELGIYDLIILDVMLPVLDGRQAARRLRERRCSTPILMLTALSDLEDRIEGLDAGADYYLARAGRWTSCAMATRLWICRRACCAAARPRSGCPPENSMSCVS